MRTDKSCHGRTRANRGAIRLDGDDLVVADHGRRRRLSSESARGESDWWPGDLHDPLRNQPVSAGGPVISRRLEGMRSLAQSLFSFRAHALVKKYRGTFLLSTPTFCAGYARKCSREEFASLRYVLVGAEKLREPVARAFREAFGVELLEGYGCTEMSPVVAVNTPGFAAGRDTQTGAKAGTVGQPLPGVAIRIVDPDTREPLPAGREGLLLVKGPNRMLGYLRPAGADRRSRGGRLVQHGRYRGIG